MAGIWLIVILGVVSIFIFPWLFTRSSGLPSFIPTGAIGDTINGIAGPFIALGAATLTYMAFWVQYQSNREQKLQFERQNQDQLFFKLLDTQESRVVNSSFYSEKGEVRSFQLLEIIVEEFKADLNDQSRDLARELIRGKPELLASGYLMQMFAFNSLRQDIDDYVEAHFDELKQEFLQKMSEKDQNERWEYIKMYLDAPGREKNEQREFLESIGNLYFYKIDFEDRADNYKRAFDNIEKKYGSFLDGYLKGWEFLCLFADQSIGKKDYIKYISSQLSKFEMIILFYYIASGYADEDLKRFIRENKLLGKLFYYNMYLLDAPSEDEIDAEVKTILV